MESATTKRGYSNAERIRELDRAGRRPRRIIWAHCHHHGGGYYFFDIRVKPWADEPDMRKVHGLCMECESEEILYVGADELVEHRYHPIDLCVCGLPHYHKNPPPQFLQQYNARPVPCRNGRANV